MTDSLAHRGDRPPMSEAEQAAFFADALERAREAEARTVVHERFIGVAGVTVRLVFAGAALERALYPAVAHLETGESDHPDATFHVWDTETSGVEAPASPCGRDSYTDRGDIWGMDSPRWRSAFHWAEFTLNLMDAETGEAVFWVRAPKMLPFWTRASPFRTLFHWLMQARGRQLLHAAAVGTDDGAVLIVGRGGVGKSTTALACLEAGFGYVGDDYVAVGLDPEPRAYSLYNTAKLDRPERFPALAKLITDTPSDPAEKSVLRLHPDLSAQLRPSASLLAIVTPRFAEDGQTRFEPVEAAALNRAAAFTTLAQLPHAGLETHAFIGRLIEALPRRTLTLGPDLQDVTRKIAEFLAASPKVETHAAMTTADAPALSVVVPVHNGARFLHEAIASVLAQAYPRIEIIVVDDGSTDEIEAAVRTLPVDVRFIRQRNMGAAAARNRGFREASGELVAFLDVDDLWPERALDVMTTELRDHPELDAVHGHGQLFSREDGELRWLSHAGETFPYYIGAAVFRRRALEQVGLFDESLGFSEDTDWFLRARERGLNIERLDQPTLWVRRHDANMTRGKSLVEVNALRVFKKALDRRREKGAG
jgi:hypothetical protein